MKTTQNRLCTLTQIATQAITTTTKAITASLILLLSFSSGFGQCPVQVGGTAPLAEQSKCLASQATSAVVPHTASNFPDSWDDRIQNY